MGWDGWGEVVVVFPPPLCGSLNTHIHSCATDGMGSSFLGRRQWRLFAVHQVEELLTRLRVIAEHTQHGGSDRLAIDLLHAPHHHAHVTGKDNNRTMMTSLTKIKRMAKKVWHVLTLLQ